ncbi:cyclase [Streptomyces sp. R302]|uniref:aromatase/cyclase n=1 Tax=unclassified Streptomyces TaxID=2593676 RepID=UPI00145FCF59|nr:MULTISPECIES: aromatase/cyclase [unclassified Streptomyces]NML55461.1 cyclase [Streptomyces sp. R301]NML79619.1 cyclase [Streptomyces sp. R302]
MTTREVEHDITIAAPAPAVYRLLAEVENWPLIFPPTIHVDRVEESATQERIRIWATANGEAKNWTSRRELFPDELRITFRQEVSPAPVASMGGTWIIEALGEDECRVRLLHDYRAIDDDPHDLLWIDEAVDRNSRSELAALKKNVELVHGARELTFSFEDSVRVDGEAKDVFAFIDEADRWPERLPHVATVRFSEDTPGLQSLEMDTRAKDGSVHTTKSYRVTFPHAKIAYKQVTLPALMTLHTGRWTFVDDGTSVVATSQHTVTLNADNIAAVLGAEATVDDARSYVHTALSTNSLATLNHAKAFAESKRRP